MQSRCHGVLPQAYALRAARRLADAQLHGPAALQDASALVLEAVARFEAALVATPAEPSIDAEVLCPCEKRAEPRCDCSKGFFVVV
jgi:hypothetical protein